MTGEAYLIGRVRRDAAGRIPHVGWYPRKSPPVCLEVDVAVVIAALRDGAQAHVVIATIIGRRVQVSPDGTTIVDSPELTKPFGLRDVPPI